MSIMNELLLSSEILKDVQILVVDNDRDSGNLYAFLLESYGAKVTTIGSVKDALNFLDSWTPTLLICEIRFLHESVYPLIQRIRHLALNAGRVIPILVTSTYATTSFAQHLTVQIEAYLLKPIDIDYFVNEVWCLTFLSSIVHAPSIQDWMMQQNPGKRLGCGALVNGG